MYAMNWVVMFRSGTVKISTRLLNDCVKSGYGSKHNGAERSCVQ